MNIPTMTAVYEKVFGFVIPLLGYAFLIFLGLVLLLFIAWLVLKILVFIEDLKEEKHYSVLDSSPENLNKKQKN